MEARAVAATPDPLINGITVWTSTQAPHWNRNSIADALGLPATRVRAVAPEVGGGFGVKIGAYQEDFIAALAFKMRRPLKWIETRSENFLATNHGRDQWADVEIAAELDGRIRGLRMHVVQDLGGFPRGTDLAELTGRMSSGCYDIPALEFRSRSVYTNKMALGAYRGAGRPEAAYYVERAIDLLADTAGWIRSKCDVAISSHRSTIATQQPPASVTTPGTTKALDYAIEVSGYEALRGAGGGTEERTLPGDRSRLVRRDLRLRAVRECDRARRDQWRRDGLHGHLAPWSGAGTSFAQIVADGLGVPMDKIGVNHGDTLNTPQGNGTMGSRGLAVGGGAVVMAMDKVRDRAKAIAAHLLEAAAEDIEIVEGAFRVRGVPDRGVSLEEIADKAYSDELPAEFGAGWKRPSTSALTMRHFRLAPTSRSSRSFPTRVK